QHTLYPFYTYLYLFFFNDTATTEIYTLSLHDALPICGVQKTVLEPGLYPVNPEVFSVDQIEIGYNQITMAHAGKLPVTQTTGQMPAKARQAEAIGAGLQKSIVPSGQSGVPVLPAVTFPSSD